MLQHLENPRGIYIRQSGTGTFFSTRTSSFLHQIYYYHLFYLSFPRDVMSNCASHFAPFICTTGKWSLELVSSVIWHQLIEINRSNMNLIMCLIFALSGDLSETLNCSSLCCKILSLFLIEKKCGAENLLTGHISVVHSSLDKWSATINQFGSPNETVTCNVTRWRQHVRLQRSQFPQECNTVTNRTLNTGFKIWKVH